MQGRRGSNVGKYMRKPARGQRKGARLGSSEIGSEIRPYTTGRLLRFRFNTGRRDTPLPGLGQVGPLPSLLESEQARSEPTLPLPSWRHHSSSDPHPFCPQLPESWATSPAVLVLAVPLPGLAGVRSRGSHSPWGWFPWSCPPSPVRQWGRGSTWGIG